jgi:hypothetical protein
MIFPVIMTMIMTRVALRFMTAVFTVPFGTSVMMPGGFIKMLRTSFMMPAFMPVAFRA